MCKYSPHTSESFSSSVIWERVAWALSSGVCAASLRRDLASTHAVPASRKANKARERSTRICGAGRKTYGVSSRGWTLALTLKNRSGSATRSTLNRFTMYYYTTFYRMTAWSNRSNPRQVRLGSWQSCSRRSRAFNLPVWVHSPAEISIIHTHLSKSG